MNVETIIVFLIAALAAYFGVRMLHLTGSPTT